MIVVGTSGFQYREWASVFYPGNLDPKSRLRYYSRRFGECPLDDGWKPEFYRTED